MKLSLFLSIAIIAAVAFGQTPPAAAPAPAPKRAAAPKAASPVDSVIQLVKAGMSDDLIVKSLKKTNKPADLSPADMVKLKQAGLSEAVIGAMVQAGAPKSRYGSAYEFTARIVRPSGELCKLLRRPL